MFTTKDGKRPHTHQAEVDGNGEGETIDTSDGPKHRHDIYDFKVEPGGDDEHTHELVTEEAEAFSESPKASPKVITEDRRSIKEAIDKHVTPDKKGKKAFPTEPSPTKGANPTVVINVNVGK
jgi:hypothetical protein